MPKQRTPSLKQLERERVKIDRQMEAPNSMLEPDRHIDSALQVAIESMQEVVGRGNQELEEYASKTLATLRFFVSQLVTSSQMTREQQQQLQELIVLLYTNPAAPAPRKIRKRTRKES